MIFSCWRKERFNELSARSPFTIISRISQLRILRARMWSMIRYSSWRESYSPCALWFGGLAIEFMLCAAGYKLSINQCHTAPPSQVPHARLWIESRDISDVTVLRIKSKAHHVFGSQPFFVHTQRLPHLSRTAASMRPVSPLDLVYYDSLIQLRSPPAYRLSLT